MKTIFKSFLKTYLKNWYQTFAFIIFILISSALTIGFISNSLQVTLITSQINYEEKKWDYEFDATWNNYDDNFIYNYFQNENEITNQLEEKLLVLPAIIDIEVDGKKFETLDDYMQYAFDNYQKDLFPDYQAFLGNFIKTKVFSYSWLYRHQIQLPNYQQKNPTEAIVVDFYDVINEKWWSTISEQYNVTQNLVNEYLVEEYNALFPNNKIAIDYSFHIWYKWNNMKLGNTSITYNLEPINLDMSNNVVTNLNYQTLKNMKDNEILVNEKFATTYNLKIGDVIKINDAVTKKEDSETPFFSKEYKIIGFGIKSTNLISATQMSNGTSDEAIIYLTDHEMTNYLRYLWLYDTRFWLPNGSDAVIDFPTHSHRLLANGDDIQKFNTFTNETIKAGEVLANIINYDDLVFVQILKLLIIQSVIFIVIGACALLLSLLFVNYCVNKELKQIASQLGLFKSMGYKNIEIASILWTRTFFTLIVGFALGFLASIPIQIYVNHLLVSNFLVIVQEVWTNAIFLLIFFAILPTLLSMLNLWSINRYLSFNSLQMIQITGSSQLEQQKNKYFGWYKKKIALPHFKFVKSFSVKQIVKSFLIPFFFTLGSTILVLELNSQTLMSDLMTSKQNTYNFDIDHMFTLSKKINLWYDEETKKYDFDDSDQYNLKYEEYNNLDDLISKQDQGFIQLLNHYLTIDRKEPLSDETKQEILATLNLILETNVNYGVYSLNDFESLLDQIVKDYDLFIKEILPDLEDKITEIKEQWVDKFNELNKHLSNKRTQLTFNNLFIKPNIDFPILQIYLENDGFTYPASENWTLDFVDDYNKDIFYLDHNYDKLKQANFNDYDERTLPVVITNHFSTFNKINVGDKFVTSLARSHDDSNIQCQVIAINESDTSSNKIYASSDYFFSKLLSPKISTPIYNTVFSKSTLLTSPNTQNLTINSDYFNFYYPTSSNQQLTIREIFEDSSNLSDFVNWNNINTKDFRSLTLERNATNKQATDFINLITILIVFTLSVLGILFVTLSIINSIDFKHETIILKAFGYTNNWINLKLLKKYMFAIIIAIVSSTLITYFVWQIAIKLLYNMKLLVSNPFGFLPIMIMIVSLLIVFALAYSLSLIIIKRVNPAPK